MVQQTFREVASTQGTNLPYIRQYRTSMDGWSGSVASILSISYPIYVWFNGFIYVLNIASTLYSFPQSLYNFAYPLVHGLNITDGWE